jgi:uncharacterized membrane protein YsdA (DUF1294 family)
VRDLPPVAVVAAAVYLVVSLVTFVCYAWDKRQAGRGGSRVPERTLHLLALLGGWPGALLGRHVLRHKTRKPGFTLLTWTIVLLHLAAWTVWGDARN